MSSHIIIMDPKLITKSPQQVECLVRAIYGPIHQLSLVPKYSWIKNFYGRIDGLA